MTGAKVTCAGVGGDVKSNGSIEAMGNISGDVKACTDISCTGIDGDVTGTKITCGNIEGDIISCDGDIHCNSISGDVSCGGNIYYENQQ